MPSTKPSTIPALLTLLSSISTEEPPRITVKTISGESHSGTLLEIDEFTGGLTIGKTNSDDPVVIQGTKVQQIHFPKKLDGQGIERAVSDVLKRKEVEVIRRQRNIIRKKPKR